MSFKRISRETIYDAGFIKLITDTVEETTTGETFTRTGVEHLGSVMILPVFENGEIMLIKQYRAIIDKECLETVAGRKDVSGESPELCARRELKEELGVSAEEVFPLGEWVSSPGFNDELIHAYIGINCKDNEEPEPDGIEERFSTKVRMSFEEAFEAINSGEILDAKTALIIYRAAQFLEDGPSKADKTH